MLYTASLHPPVYTSTAERHLHQHGAGDGAPAMQPSYLGRALISAGMPLERYRSQKIKNEQELLRRREPKRSCPTVLQERQRGSARLCEKERDGHGAHGREQRGRQGRG